MMGGKQKFLIGSCVAMVLLVVACIDPYNPPAIENAENYLVVDGFLDSSTGDGTVTLSQTISLSSEGTVPYVNDAQVQLELKVGGIFPFSLTGNGTYTISSAPIGFNQQSRLKINWNGNVYYSEYVVSQTTPPIDSVTWAIDPTNLKIQISSHDALDGSRHYRWKYEETYEFVSAFYSGYYYDVVDKEVKFRQSDQDIYRCWATQPSTNVLLATTTGLNENRIDKIDLVTMTSDTYKVAIRYSILVTQLAISKREYDFWNEIKKSTESIGTIFDPLPSRVLGNLYLEGDSGEPVLGYFSVSSAESERIFIDNSELPQRRYASAFSNCHYTSVDSLNLDEFFQNPTTLLIISGITDMMGNTIGYTTAPDNCIDCRKRLNGKTTKPDFW